jgi:phosphate transport system protein
MEYIENEINLLRFKVLDMAELVQSQFERCIQSLKDTDYVTAANIIRKEKKIDKIDKKIDRRCERLIALYQPVANDLRFIFSVIKINNNLENIGDNLNAIAEIILKLSEPFSKEVLEKVKLFEMMELALNQYSDVINAFIRKENETARELIPNDNEIDEIKHSSVRVLIQMIKENPQETETYIHLISILNRVEKIGDYAENIAKEIVFSVEGKIYKREIDSDNSFEESEV